MPLKKNFLENALLNQNQTGLHHNLSNFMWAGMSTVKYKKSLSFELQPLQKLFIQLQPHLRLLTCPYPRKL